MISLTAPRFPRDARVPDLHAECAVGTLAMCAAYGVPLSLSGSALEPEHAPLDLPRACSFAVTVAPPAACSSCRGRGHVVERWTGSYWLTLRAACNACGVRGGDAGEFFRENDAREKESKR